MKKIGIIGCGRQAPKHIKGYLENGITDIFVSDILNDKAQDIATEFGIKCMDIDELISSREIVSYSVCTPPNTHDEIIEKLILNNKNFLCEKPISLSIDSLNRFIKMTKRNHTIAMGGYIYKFSPAYKNLRKLIHQKKELSINNAYLRVASPGSDSPWQYSKLDGGGVINELVVHMIDLVQWCFGPIKEIKFIKKDIYLPNRKTKFDNIKIDAEDYIFIKLMTEGNINIDIEADLISKEFVQFLEINNKSFYTFCSIQPNLPLWINNKMDNNKVIKYFDFQNLYISQIKYFLDCVDRKIPHSISTLEESTSICNIINQLKEN